MYGNSNGFIGGYASTRHSLSCVMIAEADGQMQRDYWYDVNRQGELLADPRSIGQRAAQRAASRLGARPVPTCEVPVLFSAELAGGCSAVSCRRSPAATCTASHRSLRGPWGSACSRAG